ncbi:MAG TPA: dienelactone hydrolase family protein [Solirubrobacterales bacterium]|nr:dienelactone hydrolase family protein [Solirubrobacterales bacterium]
MCFQFDASPPELPADRLLPIAGGAAAEQLELRSADGTAFAAALAESPQPSGTAIAILPDIRGLYRFYVELAERFAAAGHHAIAIDYFGRTAGVAERAEDFDHMSHVAAVVPENVQADLAPAIARVLECPGAERVVSVGFCFGGAQSFLAATNADLGLDGAVGFYGTLDPSKFGIENMPFPLRHGTETKVRVLGLFGGADDFIPPADIETFDGQLAEAGVEHELITYDGCPHSFFDRAQEQFADQSADAWRRVLDFVA